MWNIFIATTQSGMLRMSTPLDNESEARMMFEVNFLQENVVAVFLYRENELYASRNKINDAVKNLHS